MFELCVFIFFLLLIEVWFSLHCFHFRCTAKWFQILLGTFKVWKISVSLHVAEDTKANKRPFLPSRHSQSSWVSSYLNNDHCTIGVCKDELWAQMHNLTQSGKKQDKAQLVECIQEKKCIKNVINIYRMSRN